MPLKSLHEDLDAIAAGVFDYGIVPGSATVFVRDKIRNMGRLDLTLLEGVLVVIDVTEETGYMVTSCSALSSVGLSVSTARNVQSHTNAPFESMESLLLAISPIFCQRFQELLLQKLQHPSGTEHADDPIDQLLRREKKKINTKNNDGKKDEEEVNEWIHP